MEYLCRTGTATGKISESVYVADDKGSLTRKLEEKGLHVFSIKRRNGIDLTSLSLFRQRQINPREFLVFNQELATLLEAGMPLMHSLDLLRKGISSSDFRSVLDNVHDQVKAGVALSDAFAVHGDLFPGAYIASLLAGERSGGLEAMLRRYVRYEKIISKVKRRTVSALVYPVVLIVLALIVVGVIVLRVAPEFADFYASFNAELPLATRLIVTISSALTDNIWWFIVLAIGGAFAALTWYKRSIHLVVLDRFVLNIPWLGSIACKFTTSQMSRALATLLSGGIPLVNAIDTAAHAMSNRYMANHLLKVGQRVREGERISRAMSERGVFPDVAVRMIEAGESTGALQDMLNSVADFYDEDVETNLARFVALVEPVLLVLMGIVIAGLLLALYMPLFQLSSVLP